VKRIFDLLTVLFSFINAYATHTSIRDRQFGNNTLFSFCQAWFVLDVLLCFFTEVKTGDGMHLKEPARVWARYLTTWFVVDVLSLFPGEAVYLRPLIDAQNSRGFLKKSVFRTRAVLRVTRWLRGRHVRWFGQVAHATKQWGCGGSPRLLRLLIQYVPKYWLFLRNMKAVVAVRLLRQVHWTRKIWLNHRSSVSAGAAAGHNEFDEDDDEPQKGDDDTYSMSDEDDGMVDWTQDDNDDDNNSDDDDWNSSYSSQANEDPMVDSLSWRNASFEDNGRHDDDDDDDTFAPF
jgi:hypothetical protein